MTSKSPPRPPSPKSETPEVEYQRLNPGAGGPPSLAQVRAKRNPKTTSVTEADIAGSQNEDLRGSKPKGPRGMST